jgi:deazaflavin-dependent oxidoreductase (nitroreductase family)
MEIVVLSDWNQQIIKEFRANNGNVGGQFAGAPMALVHHVGRKSGTRYVTPLVYQPKDGPDDSIYVFAAFAGAPEHPDWYYNLAAAGQGIVEVGTDVYEVTVSEVTGDDRNRVWAKQVSLAPGFGDYEKKTAGIRVIPILELTRR